MTQFKRLLGFVIPFAVIFTMIGSFTPALGAEFTADVLITGPGDNYTFKLQVKDNRYRLQKVKGPMNVSPFPSIVNRDTGVTWGLNGQMHQYVEIKDIEKTIMMNPLVGWAMTRKGLTEKPGPTETVNGYECETRIYTETGKSEPAAKVWISKKLNHIIRDQRFGLNKNPVLELQNIQEGAVDAALFKIPAGYTKMDMGAGPGSKPVRSPAKTESTQVRTAKTTPTPAPVPMPASSLAQAPGQSISAAASSGNIMFILDASGSMWGQVEGKAKIAIAKEVLTGLIRDLPDDAVVGLVAYGHRRKGDCKDVQELVPLSPVDKNKLIKTIQGLSPKGKTPISRSVRMTAEGIKHLEDETTIILVSDGKETCDPDPCGLVKELKADGIKFVMHVIGFDVTEEEQEQLECMAKTGGGRYYTAGNAGEFLAAAREVVEAPTFTGGYLEITSLKEGRPFEARVDVYRHSDNKSMGSKNTWYHKKPAEFKLVPGTYYLKVTDRSVRPHQRQEIRDIEIVSGQTVEKNVSFVAGGVLKITAIRDGQPFEARADVYRQSDNKRIGDKNTWYHKKPAEFKLVPGVYYLKVFVRKTREKKEIRDIEVVSGRTVEKTVVF
jgi:Ca-activated chloride channel homolog